MAIIATLQSDHKDQSPLWLQIVKSKAVSFPMLLSQLYSNWDKRSLSISRKTTPALLPQLNNSTPSTHPAKRSRRSRVPQTDAAQKKEEKRQTKINNKSSQIGGQQ